MTVVETSVSYTYDANNNVLSFSSLQFVGCMIAAAAVGAGVFTILTISGGLAFPILFLGIFTAGLDVVGSSALFANCCTPFGPFLT